MTTAYTAFCWSNETFGFAVGVEKGWGTHLLIGVPENALTARSVDVSMAGENQRSAILLRAVLALLVYKRPARGFGTTDADAVFLTGRLELVRWVTAGAAAEKQEIVVDFIYDPAELIRAFDVWAGGVLFQVRVGRALDDAERWVGHLVLENTLRSLESELVLL